MDIKGEIDNNIVRVGKFNMELTSMDIFSRENQQAILRKKNKVRGLTILERLLKSKQPGTGIRTGMQKIGTEHSSETNPHPYGQLIFDNGGKNI